jgi:hypothetical protein
MTLGLGVPRGRGPGKTGDGNQLHIFGVRERDVTLFCITVN